MEQNELAELAQMDMKQTLFHLGRDVKMNLKHILTTFFVLSSFFIVACSSDTKDSPTAVKSIATDAGEGVEVVGMTSGGEKGAPILILEELHNSRAGQVQHAISLVRLHDKYNLRLIGLEGYLKERPKIDTNWFKSPGNTPVEKARVTVRLLQEGEISAAEFMALTYDDISLIPVEDQAGYNVELGEGAIDAVLNLSARIDSNLGENVRKKLDEASNGKPLSAEDQLSMAEDIERRRVERGIQLSASEQVAWASWLAFWRGRAGGNRTMFDSTVQATERLGAPIIAMNVGSAHTQGICKLLKASGYPFAVLTPTVTKDRNERGDLEEGFDRKYKKMSVFSVGFLTEALQNSFKKPEPSIPNSWFQAKAETYLFVDRIAAQILGPSGQSGGGKPPYKFSSDEFRTRLIYIDPRRIAVVGNSDSNVDRAVLFPLVYNPSDKRKRKEVWIKAALTKGPEQAVESVEAMLKRAFDRIQADTKAPKNVEDSKGQIQMSTRTVAAVGPDKESVNRKILSSV
jgi:hypothetical protein